MSGSVDDSPRCSRCRAPVSRSGGRCPFCGAPIEGKDGPKPFEPAPVGMSDKHLERVGRPPASAVRLTKPARTEFSRSDKIKAILVAMVVLAVVVFALARKKALPVDEVAAPSAVESGAAVPSAPLNINGIAMSEGASVDPTDVLPAVKARLAEAGREASLIGIAVTGARGGKLNLDEPGAQVTYRFLLAPSNPRMERYKPPAPDVVEMTLSAEPPPIRRSAPGPGDKAVIEPTCVWSAAWGAAVASGLSASEVVDATFGTNSKTGGQTWIITPRDRPTMATEIDGRTCSIKTR